MCPFEAVSRRVMDGGASCTQTHSGTRSGTGRGVTIAWLEVTAFGRFIAHTERCLWELGADTFKAFYHLWHQQGTIMRQPRGPGYFTRHLKRARPFLQMEKAVQPGTSTGGIPLGHLAVWVPHGHRPLHNRISVLAHV